MKPDALNATHPQHRQRVVVLQPSELALDGGAATVEPLPQQAAWFVPVAGSVTVVPCVKWAVTGWRTVGGHTLLLG